MANHGQQEYPLDQPTLPGLEDLAAATPSETTKTTRMPLDPSLVARQILHAYEWGVEHAQQSDSTDPADDPRYENLLDGAGFTVARANKAVTGMPSGKNGQEVFTEPPEAVKTADSIRHAAKNANRTRKPRGTSYPRDESRADIDFDPNPPVADLTAIRATEGPGETYTGSGLAELRRTMAGINHDVVRRQTDGSSENLRIAVERARLERNQAS